MPRRPSRSVAVAGLAVALGLSACSADPTPAADAAVATPADGLRVVSAEEGGALLADAPADLVVLDVRTPAEFAEGHLPGAINVDLQSPDFRTEIAQLDRDVPYLLYCRSGNRSAQARQVMEELGFRSVADVAGGIVAWQEAGLPLAG